jgi:hypothetical protein
MMEVEVRHRGQALTEFAIVLPLFLLSVFAIIQFALFAWTQNTLNGVARETARWASSQTTCGDEAGVVAAANDIARSSVLFGYTAGGWTAANVVAEWPPEPGHPEYACPPAGNIQHRTLTLRITHTIPVFFPLVPATLETTTRTQMEPDK